VIASFDHQLRPESAEELEFVSGMAAEWGLPFHGGGGDIARLAKGKNLEDVARRERYAFLRRVAASYGNAVIATGHHQDDQAETLLQHLLRGCGTAGLSAISPKEGAIIRPLLCLNRQEIENYAQRNHLEFRQDQSNFSGAYQRNRLRWNLLPQLAEYNPQVVSALNITADICREEDALLDDLAGNALAESLDNEGRLPMQALSEMPLALSRRLVRKLFCLRVGERHELSFLQVERILSLREGQVFSLPGGKLAICRDSCLDIVSEIPALPTFTEEIRLSLGENWQPLADWGWEYLCQPVKAYSLPVFSALSAASSFVCLFPATDIVGLHWRTRREGDFLPSCGTRGKRKLKELFIDKRIFPSQRRSWPLLVDAKQIRWVPGLWKEKAALCPEKMISDDMILIKVRQGDNIKG
ncbi:MAG: tRNA lysidine(34) synthetase TilS, partial [Bacillota bacterium]|nr:tRNA lysidine(34) synthetase TilS [Bacillota bacterium]